MKEGIYRKAKLFEISFAKFSCFVHIFIKGYLYFPLFCKVTQPSVSNRPLKKAIKNFYEHLNLKGILFLDLPNHLKEIRECNNVKKHTSYNLPEGRFDSTEISCKKGNKWVEKWYGIVRKGNKVSKFKDIWEEFIFQPKMLVISLKKIGFKILKIYGSMMGDRFDKNKSWRIVYLCRK